eukprot:825549-Alexandrium_andersonii.AAC.1
MSPAAPDPARRQGRPLGLPHRRRLTSNPSWRARACCESGPLAAQRRRDLCVVSRFLNGGSASWPPSLPRCSSAT